MPAFDRSGGVPGRQKGVAFPVLAVWVPKIPSDWKCRFSLCSWDHYRLRDD